MNLRLLTDPGIAVALIGVPWLLGTALVLGTLGMAITELIRATWRWVRRRLRAGDELEPELTAEERLMDACVEGGLPEAEARRLLERAVNAALAQASLTAVALPDAITVTVARPGPDSPTLSMQLPEVRRG